MTTTSPCGPFLPNSAACVLITACTYNSAACHLKYSNIFCKILQQQSFSSSGTDGDGKHGGICRKGWGCYQCVAFSDARRLAFAPSRQLWQFHGVSCPGKNGKWREGVASTSHNFKRGIDLGFFFLFFFIFFTSSLAFLRVCLLWERLWKAKWCWARFFFDRSRRGWAVPAPTFSYDGSISHF